MQHPRVDQYLDLIRDSLPPGWTAVFVRSAVPELDGCFRVKGPDGTGGIVLFEMKRRLPAQNARDLVNTSRRAREGTKADGLIVFTPFASPMARQRLREGGVSYLDLTGNVWFQISRPALFIERHGADKDPDPPRRELRSLKGPKAARVVRALSDWRPPVGVRELAARAGADPGYTTRVVSLLEKEDVVRRGSRGNVAEVRWQDLLRRWSMDYSVSGTNHGSWYVAPRGIPTVLNELAGIRGRRALTGSFAIPQEARVAAGALLSCYVEDPDSAITELDLRPAAMGANVLLLEPFDDVVFQRTRKLGEMPAVALSQCAVDLLTGVGREPAEGEALLAWMAEHEDAWRA